MTEYEEALSLLRQIERNQQRGLELQAEQVAMVRDQMVRTEPAFRKASHCRRWRCPSSPRRSTC